jgi:hypothetical protein
MITQRGVWVTGVEIPRRISRAIRSMGGAISRAQTHGEIKRAAGRYNGCEERLCKDMSIVKKVATIVSYGDDKSQQRLATRGIWSWVGRPSGVFRRHATFCRERWVMLSLFRIN